MKSLLSHNGRKTIAVLSGNMNTRYDFDLMLGIRAACRLHNFNLLNLVCGSMDSTNVFKYEFEYNQLYFLLTSQSVDGLILMPSLIVNYSKKERLQEVLDNVKGLPLVTISEPIPGYPGVFVDNIQGIRALVCHLHEQHGKRRFAFLSGPVNNAESNNRLEGFKLGLADCKLAFDDRYVFPGNFWVNSGKAGAAYFCGGAFPRPEAIICANDYTAQGVYEKLKELGISIPGEIAVTGYDNLYSSEFFNPPLTSVSQPFEQMALRAVEILSQQIQGKSDPQPSFLRTELIFRRSCGCQIQNVDQGHERDIQRIFESSPFGEAVTHWLAGLEAALGNEVFPFRDLANSFNEILYRSLESQIDFGLWHQFYDGLKTKVLAYSKNGLCKIDFVYLLNAINESIFKIEGLQRGQIEVHQNDYSLMQSGVVRRLINVFSLKSFLSNLEIELPRLGVRSFFLVRYPKAFIHRFEDRWQHPEYSEFLFGYQAGKAKLGVKAGKVYKTAQLLPKGLEFEDRPYNFTIVGMFFRETQFGYMIFEASVDDQHVYHDLATQVSSAYNSILVFEERQDTAKTLTKTMRQLRQSNQKLNELSTHDALTGMYNRRGFILLSEKFHDLALRNKTNYVLFFADVDGLKAINDTWGHGEGDAIICACAKVLRDTFRASDIIARLGGDEFTIFSANLAKEKIPTILGRLRATIAQHNQTSGKPYDLSVSIGEVAFSDFPSRSFHEILDQADAILYERKKARKAISNS